MAARSRRSNADQLLNQLDALQTDLETGRCDFVAGHAQEVRAAATELPATVDPEVKQGVLEATDQIVELSQDPDQCSSSSGATGETDSTSTDTSTAEEPTTAPTTTSTETTTAEEEPTQPEGEQGSDQGGQTETPPQGGGEPPGRQRTDRAAARTKAAARPRAAGSPAAEAMRSTISDRYELGDRLGSGGMSTVYRATDRVLERTVAVKILAEHLSDDDKFVARFRREALSVAKLIHPNIVQVYDTGVDEYRHYIVMEYVEGKLGRPAAADPGLARRRRRPRRSASRPAPGSSTRIARGSSTATSSPGT